MEASDVKDSKWRSPNKKNHRDDEIRHDKDLTRRAIMKSKRFSVEQIVSALKQHEAGLPIAEIARKLGIAEGTFYA